MATLKTNTLTGTTTAGSIAVTGEGNSTTTNLQQGLAKNWSQVKGTDTFTLNDSFNVSSATDQGTGVARINLTSNFNNTNYSASATHNSSGWGYNGTIDDVTTSTYDIHSQQTNTTGSADSPRANSATHGDLA